MAEDNKTKEFNEALNNVLKNTSNGRAYLNHLAKIAKKLPKDITYISLIDNNKEIDITKKSAIKNLIALYMLLDKIKYICSANNRCEYVAVATILTGLLTAGIFGLGLAYSLPVYIFLGVGVATLASMFSYKAYLANNFNNYKNKQFVLENEKDTQVIMQALEETTVNHDISKSMFTKAHEAINNTIENNMRCLNTKTSQ